MNRLNNKYPQKQSQPLEVQDKEITDDKKIANRFNAYFTNAHKLANNLKKQENTSKDTPRYIQIETSRKFLTQTFRKKN